MGSAISAACARSASVLISSKKWTWFRIRNYLQNIPLPSKYPQAPEKDYAAAVVLFTPAGNSYRAAAAVYRFYAEYPWRGWAFWAYQKFRWFSALSEWGYRLVANHRRIFRWLVTLFWGKSFALSSYRASGWVFGRMLGVTTLIAFLSLWVQSAGLIGPEGIVPFQENLDQVRDSSANGTSPWLLRPTLLWLISGTGGLSFLFTIGTLAALLLIIGFVPHFAVMTGWVCYLICCFWKRCSYQSSFYPG